MSEAQKKGGIGHKKLRADGYLYIFSRSPEIKQRWIYHGTRSCYVGTNWKASK